MKLSKPKINSNNEVFSSTNINASLDLLGWIEHERGLLAGEHLANSWSYIFSISKNGRRSNSRSADLKGSRLGPHSDDI